jgi:hypothetical protein
MARTWLCPSCLPADHAVEQQDRTVGGEGRRARCRYLTVDACRQAGLCGEGTTAVAWDSTHFSAFDQNIFTGGSRATWEQSGGRPDLLDGRHNRVDGRA